MITTEAQRSLFLRYFRKALARECPDLTVRVELCVGSLFRTQRVLIEVRDCTYSPFTDATMWARQLDLYDLRGKNYQKWRSINNVRTQDWYNTRFRQSIYRAHHCLSLIAQELSERFEISLPYDELAFRCIIPVFRLDEYIAEFDARFSVNGIKQ